MIEDVWAETPDEALKMEVSKLRETNQPHSEQSKVAAASPNGAAPRGTYLLQWGFDALLKGG